MSRRPYFLDRRFFASYGLGLLLLAVSLLANFYAGGYAARRASNPVTDVVLDNIPVFDVDQVFVNGAIIFGALVAALCILRPRWAPFSLKAISLFVAVRSISITLTHIGPSPERLVLPPSAIFSKITFGGDLFFSGHTGLPFLMALVFWNVKVLRYGFFAISALFGAAALMGHLHYTIDVFAAPFITYAIYKIAERAFPSDLHLFRTGELAD